MKTKMIIEMRKVKFWGKTQEVIGCKKDGTKAFCKGCRLKGTQDCRLIS
jgi:hypothetical protein